MRTRHNFALVPLLLLQSLNSAQAETLLIYSGRPLTYAAWTIAEAYGVPVTFEESGYALNHRLRALFPGAEPLYPKAVVLTVDYLPHVEIESVLQQSAMAAAPVLPEVYAVRQAADGVWGIMPKAGGDRSDSPLSASVHLPAEPVSTATALDILVAQIRETAGVKIVVDSVPRQLSRKAMISEVGSTMVARELLNRIAALWTEKRGVPGQFFAWQLRYGTGLCKKNEKVL